MEDASPHRMFEFKKNMVQMKTKFTTTDEYLSTFTGTTRARLEEIRGIIKKAAPKAEEVISYNMPAYKIHGVLVYFAGYREHIGFYPTGAGIDTFQEELAAYESSKGAVRFPLDKPIPKNLVTQIVKFRSKQDAEKAKLKK
jgi:uncharacterized protein YdhG (YjbR/CyaY superfamily)